MTSICCLNLRKMEHPLNMAIALEKIEGMICAPFTAFHDSGELNRDVIPRYAQMLIDSGMIGVFINGSSFAGSTCVPGLRQ